MLKSLILRNFVLVSELEIAIEPGFTVLTGETGAGKSILIDALQLALGARADASVVREGETKAEVSAIFALQNPSGVIKHWLQEAGIEWDGHELLLRRNIDAQGKSRGWVNGTPVTISQLRVLGENLVEIHGQHAWQSLSKPESARELLDAYGQIDLNPLQQLWQQWQLARKQLEEARAGMADADRECERLNWQIAEVDKLAPQEGEWHEINTEHEKLLHAQMLIESVNHAINTLNEAQINAGDLLGQAQNVLEKASSIDPELADISQTIAQAATLAADATHSLNSWLRHTDLDPERLEELDGRLSLWLSLARRYRRTPEDLPELLNSWKEELQKLQFNMDIAGLEQSEKAFKEQWLQAASVISKKRQQAAPKLSKVITAAMQGLAMKGGEFQVQITTLDAPIASGLERIDFLVAGHTGVTLRPVAKVASGGELSRLALAIAVTTSQLGSAPTLIFDEVDSGIGGSVAQTVAQFLNQLGKDRQVLSVTHLSQVAANANQHLLVSKTSDGKTTTSQVKPVMDEQRVAEIARMLDGNDQSQVSLAHAREMIGAVLK